MRGGLRVDTTVTEPVKEVGTEERDVTQIKQTHTLNTVTNCFRSAGHTITDAASNSETQTNGAHNACASIEALSEAQILVVADRAGGRSDVGLTGHGGVNCLGNTHFRGSSGSSTAANESQKLIREVEQTTEVDVSDTGQTFLDVVVESRNSVTNTLLNSNTESNLSDDVTTGLDARVL